MGPAVLCTLLLIPVAVQAQRVRNGNQIISSELPKAILEAGPGMTYAGTQTFDLYGVADAEQHFFVELDGTRIKRLLWIQYEGYHASNTSTYKYTDETVQQWGHTWFRSDDPTQIPAVPARPGSDGARARTFLKAKGWSIGPEAVQERLVWIQDSPARHELMVIYQEDLADQGLTAAELSEGGKARDKWPDIKKAFQKRAGAAFSIKEP